MKKRRPIQKRSFLLLEIVISLFLISLCFFPLLKPHISIRKIETKNLQKMEWDRHSEQAYCRLKEILFENKKHSWKELMKGCSGELYSKSDDESEIVRKGYTCQYTLKKLDETHKGDGTKALVLEAHFEFFKTTRPLYSFSRIYFVEKLP